MADLWQYFKNLFKESEESSSIKPFIHEVIERSVSEQADYQQWKKTLSRQRLLDWLNDQYVQWLINKDQLDESIDFLNTPSSKGFVIHFNKTRYPRQEIIHFFDFLKEQVLTLGYKTYLSDTRTYSKGNFMETIQRHYLKPPTLARPQPDGQFNQRFGNISIELQEKNDEIVNLKFRANSYKDRMITEAESFKELMAGLRG